jgi:hypothetical protein
MYRQSKLRSIIYHFMEPSYILYPKTQNIITKFDDLNKDHTL